MAQGRGGREQERHVDSLSAGQTKRQSEGGKIGRGEVGRDPKVGRQSQELSRRGTGLGVAVRAGTEPRGAATLPEGRGEKEEPSQTFQGRGLGQSRGGQARPHHGQDGPCLPELGRTCPRARLKQAH